MLRRRNHGSYGLSPFENQPHQISPEERVINSFTLQSPRIPAQTKVLRNVWIRTQEVSAASRRSYLISRPSTYLASVATR
jgi:hypothetical protein